MERESPSQHPEEDMTTTTAVKARPKPVAPVPPPEATAATHPDLPGVTGWIMKVDPVQAAEWLEMNVRNRPEKKRRTEGLVRDMENNRYMFTGQGIAFDTEGILIDGQHRLQAIRKSGKTILMTVWNGIEPEAQEVTDTGLPRTTRDFLSMREIPNATVVQSIAKYVWQIINGPERIPGSGQKTATNEELLHVIATFPDILAAADFAVQARKRFRPLNPLPAGIAYFLFCRFDKDTGNQFMHSIITGTDAAPGTALYLFRERLINDPGKYNSSWQWMYLIRAWNAVQSPRGGELGRLQAPKKAEKGRLVQSNYPTPAYIDPNVIETLRQELADAQPQHTVRA